MTLSQDNVVEDKVAIVNETKDNVSSASPAKINLLDLNREGLQQFFTDLGEKPFRVRQVMPWIYHRQVRDFFGHD